MSSITDADRIYNYVLKFYSIRPRSKKELLDWFKRKEVGEETQKFISEKLKKLNLINDEEFAKWWIEQRISYRQVGRKVLDLELRVKGIDRETIVRLLDCYIVGETEIDMARKLVEKKLKTLSSRKTLTPNRYLLTPILVRRGFSWDVINKVCKEYLENSS